MPFSLTGGGAKPKQLSAFNQMFQGFYDAACPEWRERFVKLGGCANVMASLRYHYKDPAVRGAVTMCTADMRRVSATPIDVPALRASPFYRVFRGTMEQMARCADKCDAGSELRESADAAVEILADEDLLDFAVAWLSANRTVRRVSATVLHAAAGRYRARQFVVVVPDDDDGDDGEGGGGGDEGGGGGTTSEGREDAGGGREDA